VELPGLSPSMKLAWLAGIAPIIAERKTTGPAPKPLSRDHGSGHSPVHFKRGATKWRCPTGEYKPKSRCVKASRRHPLVPRHTQLSPTCIAVAEPSSASSGA
jgi:hypothetical protein